MSSAAPGAGAVRPRQPRRPPTIFDVAAEAGVSKSTVSNVVRGVEEVSANTRERVLAAIERLNYKPNTIARQFVQQRTTMLGVLLGDLSNPYYAQMAQVVERQHSAGYTTMFCNIEGAQEIATAGVESLLGHRVAGIVFLAYVPPSEATSCLQEAGVPIVFLGLSESWGDSVGPQDKAGGRLATNHLLELGHRRIAYVRTPLVEARRPRPLRRLPCRDEGAGLVPVPVYSGRRGRPDRPSGTAIPRSNQPPAQRVHRAVRLQ